MIVCFSNMYLILIIYHKYNPEGNMSIRLNLGSLRAESNTVKCKFQTIMIFKRKRGEGGLKDTIKRNRKCRG